MTETSILKDVKANIPIGTDVTAFDNEIIEDINACFLILFQEGVGQQECPFVITGDTEQWDEFISGKKNLEAVKLFVQKKTKLMFDPPQNGNLLEANKDILKEIEWRLNFEHENE
jgi:hypothetical protein